MTVAHAGRWSGGTWKLAPCLVALEAEADRIAPTRRKGSDGSIGDRAHAVRRSDHNPDEEGVTDFVDALDITHDPERGMDIHARLRVVAQNVKNGIEARVSYLISNRQIFSQKNGVWAWRRYDGENPHTQHGHISVNDEHRGDTSSWFDSSPPLPTPPLRLPFLNGKHLEGPEVRFFITHPSYGIRLVTTDGVNIVDVGVTNVWSQLRAGDIGGPMSPAEFDQLVRSYPGKRYALGNLPA